MQHLLVMKDSNFTQPSSKVTNLTEVPEDVKALYEENCQREQLLKEMQAGLKALLIKHACLFAENDRDPEQNKPRSPRHRY